jgi:N-glycosylase/DNA lyase
MTVVGDLLVFVGQRSRDELIFFGVSEREVDEYLVPYFALDKDYSAIRTDISARTDSEFLKQAVAFGDGIRILAQDPWEALFSFIVSQNNNIPRIRKIVASISAAYGTNLAEKRGLSACPKTCGGFKADGGKLDTGACSQCGMCYTFPTAEGVARDPSLLLPSHPGFRYRYLTDAAEKVASGEIDLDAIKKAASYEYTVESLKSITGVGDKVASCTALFGFGNLEAFPIDVWMKRAIDEYFGGKLDHASLGAYAGVAQQYIFHYIRHITDQNGR